MGDMHTFSVDVAKEVGVNAAILLQSIKWWCAQNKANGKNHHDGLWWTYNSVKAWRELYPYLGKSAINSALKRLEERGYIRTGNFNKSAYDRTIWYAITESGLALFGESICRKSEMEGEKTGNGILEIGQPIPDANQIQTKSSTDARERPRSRKPERLARPTLEEVEAYCRERGNGIDPQHFLDYQDAHGWILKSGQPMRDWRATIRTWEHADRRFERKEQRSGQAQMDMSDFTEKVDWERLQAMDSSEFEEQGW